MFRSLYLWWTGKEFPGWLPEQVPYEPYLAIPEHPKEEYRHFDQYCPICMRETLHRQGMAVSDRYYWCTECKVAFGIMEEEEGQRSRGLTM